jgi:hypothetical protein
MKSIGQALKEMEANSPNMIEVWKDIKGYEGLYQISNLGNVKSIYRYKKKLKPYKNKNGYYYVNLYKNNQLKHLYIHRLVAENFISNFEKKSFVNHKNGIKTDNRVFNLEWCTRSENELHKHNILEKQVKKVKCLETNNIYISIADASRKTNIGKGNIWSCCNGRRQTAGGYTWRYINEKS